MLEIARRILSTMLPVQVQPEIAATELLRNHPFQQTTVQLRCMRTTHAGTLSYFCRIRAMPFLDVGAWSAHAIRTGCY